MVIFKRFIDTERFRVRDLFNVDKIGLADRKRFFTRDSSRVLLGSRGKWKAERKKQPRYFRRE